jgi:hypothetical protein
MIDFMVKNGIAMRFAEKLVNCNALFYCAQNFFRNQKNETDFPLKK